MGQANGGFGLIDVLTARAAGFAGFHDDIGGVDLDLDILRLGQDRHRGGRGLNATLGFGFGNALDAMHAAFEFEAGPDAVALHHKGDFLEAAKLGLVGVHQRELVAAGFRVHGIHTVKHGGKERRLLASRAASDLHHDVFIVVGIAGEQQDLQFLGKRFHARLGFL